MKVRILIVDDEKAFLDSVARMLKLEGYVDITTESDSTRVPAMLESGDFDIAFLDITMPVMDGVDLLKVIKEQSPQTECIMVTANDTLRLVIKTIKLGAYDYLLKPVRPEQLIYSLERALEHKRLFESLLLRSESAIEKALNKPDAFSEIVTADKNMLRLLHESELHAASNIPVLITGETGVGKELLARAVHKASRRASGPFVAVNMLALSPNLFESEFFGHARGSFTGAERDKIGYLAQARGGTLFLDEIGDLSLELQGKLLRILQEGEFIPVGKTTPEKADVRFIAATNQDLEKLVQQHRFRKDLFYRLQFAHLHIPPLKERHDDTLVLAAHFIAASDRPNTSIAEDAREMLLAYGWPGNVRELKGVIEAAMNLAESGCIKPEHLRIEARKPRQPGNKPMITTVVSELEPLADVEKRHILSVYESTMKNKSQTARILDIGLQTLHRKLKSYGIR